MEKRQCKTCGNLLPATAEYFPTQRKTKGAKLNFSHCKDCGKMMRERGWYIWNATPLYGRNYPGTGERYWGDGKGPIEGQPWTYDEDGDEGKL